MTTGEPVGSVAELWRFPVKSMRGEQLREAKVTERGGLGHRANALVDMDTGWVVSAKGVRRLKSAGPYGTNPVIPIDEPRPTSPHPSPRVDPQEFLLVPTVVDGRNPPAAPRVLSLQSRESTHEVVESIE